MRFDRLITLGLVRPFKSRAGEPRGKRSDIPAPSPLPLPGAARLPILMYHSISDDPESGVNPYFKVCTSPRRFAEQMQWLADDGWRGVTLSEGLAAFGGKGQGARGKSNERAERQEASGKPSDARDGSSLTAYRLPPTAASPPAKLVAITFDDGFRDFHTEAFPVLQGHGFSATMYLPSAFISATRKTFKSRECLTWNEVLDLQNAGAEFGSHTVNHPRLVQLLWPAIESELRDSRTELEQRLARDVRAFAYPYAFPQAEKAFAQRFCELLAEVGYDTNVTTMIDRATAVSDRFRLPRLPANSDDDRALFEAKLAGAYDWMATPQALTKAAARWLRPGSRPATTLKEKH